jgi:predicted phage-related endonuclease
MLKKYKALEERVSTLQEIVSAIFENDSDTWSRVMTNKTDIKNLKKELDDVSDLTQDIDSVQMLHTVAIDELRDNVALILDHLGVEVVQPSDKPKLKKKGSK